MRREPIHCYYATEAAGRTTGHCPEYECMVSTFSRGDSEEALVRLVRQIALSRKEYITEEVCFHHHATGAVPNE